jgi:hypothetical protein
MSFDVGLDVVWQQLRYFVTDSRAENSFSLAFLPNDEEKMPVLWIL